MLSLSSMHKTLGFVWVYIGALSFFVTLMAKDPADTHVNFDGNLSQHEYQIHFQPLTDAAFLFRGIELSSMAVGR